MDLRFSTIGFFHERVACDVFTQPQPSVFAPEDVQTVLVELDPFDHQLCDPLLLFGGQLIPHRTDALHGHDHLCFLKVGAPGVLLAGMPSRQHQLRRTQCLLDLFQDCRFDLGSGQRTDVSGPGGERRPRITSLVQVWHVVAIKTTVFLARVAVIIS